MQCYRPPGSLASRRTASKARPGPTVPRSPGACCAGCRERNATHNGSRGRPGACRCETERCFAEAPPVTCCELAELHQCPRQALDGAVVAESGFIGDIPKRSEGGNYQRGALFRPARPQGAGGARRRRRQRTLRLPGSASSCRWGRVLPSATRDQLLCKERCCPNAAQRNRRAPDRKSGGLALAILLRGEGWRMARRGLSGARRAPRVDSCCALTDARAIMRSARANR